MQAAVNEESLCLRINKGKYSYQNIFFKLVLYIYRFVKLVVMSIHLPVSNSSNTEIWYIATGRCPNFCVTSVRFQ